MYPVDLVVTQPPQSSRFWAIPVIGMLVKVIIVIPHIIILYALMLVLEVLQLVVWIPVLFGGQYPSGLFGYATGVLRWSVRLQAFLFGLTDQYPPFQLGSGASQTMQASSPSWGQNQ